MAASTARTTNPLDIMLRIWATSTFEVHGIVGPFTGPYGYAAREALQFGFELGYALGRPLQVICTAENDTRLPFNQREIPCHFWRDCEPDDARREGLRTFWSQYIDRDPLVP